MNPSQQTRPWVLCVDFGTSNTVAAVAEPGGRPRVLTIDGAHAVPSAVYLDDDGAWGTWRVGRSAESTAAVDPTRFAPTPKRQVTGGSIFLGGRAIPVHQAISAVLHKVLAEAWRQHDHTPPSVLVLTHPARWRTDALTVLAEAARAALVPLTGRVEPVLVAEPVAAAWHAARSRQLAERARIVVLDLGGGTCDVAVVDRVGDRFDLVAAPLGIDPLGGEDFDSRLVQAVLDDLGRPELNDRLLLPKTSADRLAYLDLRRSCRGAKEELSQQVRAHVRVPAVPGVLPEGASVQVSRPHRLEPLLTSDGPDRPGLDTAADLTRQAMDEAPRTTTDTSVFLVGGSSRIPLLGNLVHERTGKVPLEHGDPGTAVAEGGASVALAALEGRQVPTRPLPAVPVPVPVPEPERTPERVPEPEPERVREAERVREPERVPQHEHQHQQQGPDRGEVRTGGGGTPKRPVWLWVVVGIVAVLLLCGGISAIGAALSQGNSTSTSTGTGGSASSEPGTTPDGEEPGDGDGGGGGAATEVECWDGSTASDVVACPVLEGREAMVWLVGGLSEGGYLAGCYEVTPDETVGVQEVWGCDLDGTTVLLARWATPGDAAAYFSSAYTTVSDVGVESDGTAGTQWDECLSPTNWCAAWAYDDYPFSHEVLGGDADAVADVYSRLRVVSGSVIDAGAPF